MELTERKAGVLLPVASLPSSYGIGDFGKNAYKFVDLIAKAGYHLWQILPLNPLGYGHSPYQPFSSYAFDELYIDLETLRKNHLVSGLRPFNQDSDRISYEEVRAYKETYLKKAFRKQMKLEPDCLKAFEEENPWVIDYATFIMYKKTENMVSWDNWPVRKSNWIKHRKPLPKKYAVKRDYEIWLQKTLYEQWGALHAYANSKGIKVIGDIPFYVGYDSCDVWANQKCFLLDENKRPAWIAGVPPDYFSATGQRWGNPIYNWDYLAKHKFSFLEERIAKNAKIYDIIRLDHFRAFDTYWKIPASCPTAIDGAWIEAPGYAFFDLLLKDHPEVSIIAEDLGEMRPEVYTLRDHYSFPGMNVIEFTFADEHIKHKVDWNKKNMVAYLGTHDNQTMEGYFAGLNDGEKTAWHEALCKLGYPDGLISDRAYRFALDKQCDYVVVAMQDLLNLDDKARLNVPGVIDNVNWSWKMVNFDAFKEKVPYLKALLKASKRL